MNRRLPFLTLALVATASLVLAACAPATAAPPEAMMPEAPTAAPTEPPAPEIGTPDHPIKVLFVPSVDTTVIVTGGEIMAEALNQATGLTFEVSVPTSYAATIEEMCASPSNTMGFIPGLGYALASQLCGVDVSFKAVRFGFDVYWAQILVPRDSAITSIEDLEGLKWGFGDPGSTSGYMVPLVMLEEAGVTPGEQIQTGGRQQSAQAPCNGQGGAAPDVIQKTRILMISPPIPNDTLAFGPEFPADLRAQIEAALVAFAETEEWGASIGSQDFYNWTGPSVATDEEDDFIRSVVAAAGITIASLGQ